MRSTEVKTPRATLDDDLILEMLRGWNAGRGVFAATFAAMKRWYATRAVTACSTASAAYARASVP
jgi:hypothetical protein